MQEMFVRQLREISDFYNQALEKSQHNDASDILSDQQASAYVTRSLAAINRVAGEQSEYYKQAQGYSNPKNSQICSLKDIIGVVNALLYDVQAGYLKCFAEIIHGDMFSNYLEMATHLNTNGYKDAAAVLAGSTLEAHMRQLADKAEVEITSANGKPKKADTINADLVKANTYSKLDQKNITAWLDLRNNAAHGEYDKYNAQQVTLLISGIRDFITRTPA